jgi:hypothetical protein
VTLAIACTPASAAAGGDAGFVHHAEAGAEGSHAPPVVLVRDRPRPSEGEIERLEAEYQTIVESLQLRGLDVWSLASLPDEDVEQAARALREQIKAWSREEPIRLVLDGPRGHVVGHLAARDQSARVDLIELRPDTDDERDAIDDALRSVEDLDDLPPAPSRLPRQGARTERHAVSRHYFNQQLELARVPEIQAFAILDVPLASAGKEVAPAGSRIRLRRLLGARLTSGDTCTDRYLASTATLTLDGEQVTARTNGSGCALGRAYLGSLDPLIAAPLSPADLARATDPMLAEWIAHPFPKAPELRAQHVEAASRALSSRAAIRAKLAASDLEGAAKLIEIDLGIADGRALLEAIRGHRPIRTQLPDQMIGTWRALMGERSRKMDVRSPSLSAGPIAEDATLPIGEMHLGGYRRPTEMAYARDLLHVAMAEGFAIVVYAPKGADAQDLADRIVRESGLADAQESALDHLRVRTLDVGIEDYHAYAEDPQIPRFDPRAKAYTLLSVPPVVDADFRAFERYMKSQAHYQALGQSQGAARAFSDEADALARASAGAGRTHFSAVHAESYLEGGNVLTATRKDGSKYALVGMDSVVFSAIHLARRAAGDRPARATELDSKIESTKEIIARDLMLPPKDVLFIEQPAFHIDVDLFPLQPGKMATASYRSARALIERTMMRPDLAATEWRGLANMLVVAKREEARLQPILDRITERLQRELHLTVIEVPAPLSTGTLGSDDAGSKRQGYDLNITNGVPGRGKDGLVYYITNGTSLRALEDEVRALLTKPELGIARVYFVASGRPGPDLHSFAEENIEHGGGVNCGELHFPP